MCVWCVCVCVCVCVYTYRERDRERGKIAEKEGVLLSDDKAWLCFAIMVEPEIDVYMSEEVQPEMYEQFRKTLGAYIADETAL